MTVKHVTPKAPDARRKELRAVIDYICVDEQGRVSLSISYSRLREAGSAILWVDFA